MPATIFPSPGTAVRAAVVWDTTTQFTQLVWSELGYRLGRLRTGFEAEGDDGSFEDVLVSRFGALHLGNGPVALAAVPARERIADALTQEAILDAVAGLVLGSGASAEALVRAAYGDFGGTARKAAGPVRGRSVPFLSDLWTPYGQTG